MRVPNYWLQTVTEKWQDDARPAFPYHKERLQMYINLKNPARAKEQLVKLEETAKAAKNDSLNNDLLYTQANYYYTFGMNSQGDAYINRLISQYKEQKNYAKVDESYKTLIDIARKANKARTGSPYVRQIHSLERLGKSPYRPR